MTAKISASADGTYGVLAVGTNEAFRFGADSSGQLQGFRNKLINGGFDIWQRGTTQSTSGELSADRWYFGVTGGTYSATKGQDVGPVQGSQYGNFVTLIGTGAVGGLMYQYLEDVRTLQGDTVTLSFNTSLLSGANTGAAPYLTQNFGAGGSASVDVAAVTDTVVGTRRILTYNLPSTGGKTIGTLSKLILTMPFAGTFNLQLWNMQLERGPICTPFEHRFLGVELALCQRFFQKSALPSLFSGNVTSGQIYYNVVRLLVPMRSTAISVTVANNSATLFPSTASTVSAQTSDGFWLSRTANGTGAGNFSDSWTATAQA